MGRMVIPSEDVHKLAEEFLAASKDTQAVLNRLEKATSQIEEKWSGVTQEAFYVYYKDWREHLEKFSVLLGSIAKELHVIADRYEQADKIQTESN